MIPNIIHNHRGSTDKNNYFSRVFQQPANDSTYKHHDWRGVANLKTLADTFFVSPGVNEIANYKSLNAVIVRNTIIGADSVNGGTILLRDPWYLNSSSV